jgi:tetratricopeptide (TPR) repeat protein
MPIALESSPEEPMNVTLYRRPPRTLRHQIWMILLLAIALTAVAACNSKAPAEQAQDELSAGLTADASGNLEEAAKHYKACLALEATNKFCTFNLGVQAQNAGRAADAENSYRLALLQDPDFPSALYNLAILRIQAGSIQEGIDLYKHLIQVDPNNASGHFNLGLALAATGDTVNGEKEINEGIRLNPALVAPDTAPGPSGSSAPTVTPQGTPGPSAS